MPKPCRQHHQPNTSSPPDREQVLDSLAAAMAAIDAAAPVRNRPIEWTTKADDIIRAGRARKLSFTTIAGILAQYMGRAIMQETVRRRAVALRI